MAASSVPTACSGFRVWPYRDHFLLEPVDGREGTLRISRSDGKASPGAEPDLVTTVGDPFSACVLLGIVDLLSGPYLLFVTNSKRVGSLHGGHVFLVTETKLVRCAPGLAGLSSSQRSDEAQYVARLEKALQEHGLYYSYNADITTRMQSRQAQEAGEAGKRPGLWQQADHRLVWNSALLNGVAHVPEAAPFLVPVVQGSFQFIRTELNGHQVQVYVIARRATSRIGTRMWRRGADSLGNVANFVESEQILFSGEGDAASFVQVRGSIPVHWEQIVNLTYKPKIKTVGAQPGAAAPLHVSILREEYGSVVAVDLVNQTGGEVQIGGAFASAADQIQSKEEKAAAKNQLTYVAFDFHHVCGHTKFERLETLFDQVSKIMQEQGYFLRDASGKVLSTQSGVMRTNCVDCLDRTNVTQSLFARKALESQLLRLGLVKAGDTVKAHDVFNTAYKIAWANHGDDISKQYSGTGALKGDFVRYGKRSIHGMLQDGKNSMMRYVYNNFYDGVRQDGLDLVMGNYAVEKAKPSPFRRKGVEAFTNFTYTMLVLLFSLSTTIWAAGKGLGGDAKHLLTAGMSAILFIGAAFALKTFGKLYCDRPRLCPLK